jgi:excisionase family DNA binding protein
MRSEQQRTAANSSEQQRTAKDYNKNLLDVKEAAEFLGINPRTLQGWISTKQYPELKSIKLGRLRKFREADLLEFLESRVQTATRELKKNKPREGVL